MSPVLTSDATRSGKLHFTQKNLCVLRIQVEATMKWIRVDIGVIYDRQGWLRAKVTVCASRSFRIIIRLRRSSERTQQLLAGVIVLVKRCKTG